MSIEKVITPPGAMSDELQSDFMSELVSAIKARKTSAKHSASLPSATEEISNIPTQ